MHQLAIFSVLRAPESENDNRESSVKELVCFSINFEN